jgi:hypothetical protein
VDEKDRIDLDELAQLGLDPSAPDSEDTLKLVRYVLERGAGHDELGEAVRAGTLGPLALELALREPGDAVPFDEAARRAGLETSEAAALWRALGFPDPLRAGAPLRSTQFETLQVLAEMCRSPLGKDTTLQLARVLGGSVAQLAEAVVDAFRVQIEMPRRTAGEPYSGVVEDYEAWPRSCFPR